MSSINNSKKPRKQKTSEQIKQEATIILKNMKDLGRKIHKRRAITAVVLAVAGVGSMSTYCTRHGDIQEDDDVLAVITDKNTENEENALFAVVKHVNTSGFKENPKKNCIDNLPEHEIIVYDKGDISTWEQGDTSYDFINVGNVLEKGYVVDGDEGYEEFEPNISRVVDYDIDNMYVIKSAIDEYVECDHIDSLKFRTQPNTNEENPQFASEGTLYVFLNDKGRGEHNYKKAILVGEDGSIKRGFVADQYDYLKEKTDSQKCIGVANAHTFIRKSAYLPEFDKDNICRNVTNGTLLEIVDDVDQYSYKCTVAGEDEEFYIRKNTVITYKDFDYDVIYGNDDIGSMYGFSDEGNLIYRKDKDGNVAQVTNNHELRVDVNNSKDGYYSVWDVSTNVVGYMDGEFLFDLESGESIKSMLNPKEINNRNLEKQAEENSKNQAVQGVEGAKIKYDGDNQISVILDTKTLSIEKLEYLINYYRSRNIKINGFEISIGSACGDKGLTLQHVVDGDEVYSKYQLDNSTTSIQKVWDEMENKAGINISCAKYQDRGNMDNMIKCIEYLIEQDVGGIGLYYYSGEYTDAEVSCAAAYCYGFVKYLNEYSQAYREYGKKLPFTIDIENFSKTFREGTENYRRAENLAHLIELLGDGVKDYKGDLFCVDGQSVEEGYNVISKEKGIIIYGDTRANGQDLLTLLQSSKPEETSVKSYYELRSKLENEGYNMNLWLSCQLVGGSNNKMLNGSDLEIIKDKENYISNLSGTMKKYGQSYKDLLEDGAFVQSFLDIKSDNGGFGYDISIISDENLCNLINGEKMNTYTMAIQDTTDGNTLEVMNEKAELPDNEKSRIEKDDEIDLG